MDRKTIYFDLNGVYFNRQNKLGETGLATHFSTTKNRGEDSAIHLYSKGLISEEQFWGETLKAVDDPAISMEQMKAKWFSSYTPNPQIKRVVRLLRAFGHNCQVISNTVRERDEYLNRLFSYRDDFDAVYTSYEMNSVKPELYSVLFSMSGHNVDNAIIVDDTEINIKQLTKMFPEAKTILFSDYDSLAEGLHNNGIDLNDYEQRYRHLWRGLNRNRRTVRNFLDKEVGDNMLSEILESARFSPSARNIQPLEYLVIKSQNLREKLAHIARQPQPKEAPVSIAIIGDIERARKVGVISQHDTTTAEKGEHRFLYEDAAAAMMNMIYCAESLGISSLWISSFDESGLAKLLNIPPSYKPLTVLTLGYRASEPVVPPKRSLGERLHYEQFSPKSANDSYLDFSKTINSIADSQ